MLAALKFKLKRGQSLIGARGKVAEEARHPVPRPWICYNAPFNLQLLPGQDAELHVGNLERQLRHRKPGSDGTRIGCPAARTMSLRNTCRSTLGSFSVDTGAVFPRPQA